MCPEQTVTYVSERSFARRAWQDMLCPRLAKSGLGKRLKIEPRRRRTLEGPRAEADLARLQQRFRSVSHRHRRAMALRRMYRALRLPMLVVAGIAFLCWEVMSHTHWPFMTILKHIAAYPNCDAARAVALAPASKGEPGYWQRHDADGDGQACEPQL